MMPTYTCAASLPTYFSHTETDPHKQIPADRLTGTELDRQKSSDLVSGGLCRPARVLLVLVMPDRGRSQGGHGEQGQLHLGHSVAVQQALCSGQVSLQPCHLLLTAPQPSLPCSLDQAEKTSSVSGDRSQDKHANSSGWPRRHIGC